MSARPAGRPLPPLRVPSSAGAAPSTSLYNAIPARRPRRSRPAPFRLPRPSCNCNVASIRTRRAQEWQRRRRPTRTTPAESRRDPLRKTYRRSAAHRDFRRIFVFATREIRHERPPSPARTVTRRGAITRSKKMVVSAIFQEIDSLADEFELGAVPQDFSSADRSHWRPVTPPAFLHAQSQNGFQVTNVTSRKSHLKGAKPVGSELGFRRRTIRVRPAPLIDITCRPTHSAGVVEEGSRLRGEGSKDIEIRDIRGRYSDDGRARTGPGGPG